MEDPELPCFLILKTSINMKVLVVDDELDVKSLFEQRFRRGDP